MISFLFLDATQCMLVVTDVSEQPIGPVFLQGQAILLLDS